MRRGPGGQLAGAGPWVGVGGGGDGGAYLRADEKGPLGVLERGNGHENQSPCQWCCPLYTDERTCLHK